MAFIEPCHDLGHILAASGGLGATLDAPAIPIHEDALTASDRDGVDPLEHALNDGEDFELCAVVPAQEAETLLRDPPEGLTLHAIGTIDARPGLRLRWQDGTIEPIQAGGFDHLARP